ncbi:MAG: phosphate acyltransferase PlsX [Myxococcota bacterium]
MAFTSAIDATGFYVSVETIVGGAVEAAKGREASFALVGNSIEITRELSKFETLDLDISIHHIEPKTGEEPEIAALKYCLNLALSGEVNSVVSFVNPAQAANIAHHIGATFEKLSYPASVKIIQTPKKKALFLDVGANYNSSAGRLVELAQLGASIASLRLNSPHARIMLLENDYGLSEYKKAADLLEKSALNYLGFSKPRALFNPDIEVLVCDGYRGRIAYDAIESVSEFIYSSFKDAGKAKLYAQLGLPFGKKIWVEMAENMEATTEEGFFIAGCKPPIILFFRNITVERFAKALKNFTAFASLPFEDEFNRLAE